MVFLSFGIYLLTKLNWQTTYSADGYGFHRNDGGQYYWGPNDSGFTSTVTATVQTARPEIESREL